MSQFKSPIRAGYKYQDLFGIDLIKQWLIKNNQYKYIKFDASKEDNPNIFALDDIVAERKDGKFELLQIKFTVDSENPSNNLTFDWLLKKKKKGTSLLEKWSNDLIAHLDGNNLYQAMLKTNRRPDDAFLAALNGEKLDYSKIPQGIRKQMSAEINGDVALNKFCTNFIFKHSLPKLEDFEHELKSFFIPKHTNEYGWQKLLLKIEDWSIYKKSPPLDGKILLTHIKELLTPEKPDIISQNFYIPSGYIPPDQAFHDQMMIRIIKPGVTVIWGTPGTGKSTYVSHLINCLNKKKIHVARHHFFLSLNETSLDRIQFNTVVNSVNSQILKWRQNSSNLGINEFKQRIEETAKESGDEGKLFCLVIDGLDHVWRARGEIEQLERLFNHLLPLPDNVHLILGTQKVSDIHLPQRLNLHVQESDWLEIPNMSRKSINSFIKTYVEKKFITENDFNECTALLIKKTNGNPLHLNYTIQTIINNNDMITPEIIDASPELPGGDINKYYINLWRQISAHGQELLHLIASSQFSWPDENSLYHCIGDQPEYIEAFQFIKHMLIIQCSGLNAFHESIIVFIRNQSAHKTASERLLPKTIKWLKVKAPPYWKWAYLWLIKAEYGRTKDIINSPNRKWLSDAITKAYPINNVKRILSVGMEKALKEGKLVELVKLQHLCWRVENLSFALEIGIYPDFLSQALSYNSNSYHLDWMADNLNAINTTNLPIIAKNLGHANPLRQRKCLDEMNSRIQHGFDTNPNFLSENEVDIYNFFEITSLLPIDSPKQIIKYISKFKDSDDLFEHFLYHLLLVGRGEEFLKFWPNIKRTKKLKEKLADYSAIYFLHSNINIKLRKEHLLLRYSLMGKILLQLLGIKYKPTKHTSIENDMNYSYVINDGVYKDYFKFKFFEMLLTALEAEGNTKFKTSILKRNTHARESVNFACTMLNELAVHVALLLKNNPKELLDWTYIYEFFKHKGQTLIREYSSVGVINSVIYVLPIIGIELCYLAMQIEQGFRIPSITRINNLSDNAWYNSNRVIMTMLKWNIKLLPDEIAEQYISNIFIDESQNDKQQEKIVDICSQGMKLAQLYGKQEMVYSLLSYSSLAILGYGQQSDITVFNVMNAVDYCATSDGRDISNWLNRLEPVVNNITLYTDSNDSYDASLKFIDLVARFDQKKLPLLFKYYQKYEHYRNCDKILEELLKTADLSNTENKKLARSGSKSIHLHILKSRADSGDNNAQILLDEQIIALGICPIEKIVESHSDSINLQNENKFIDFQDYPPDKFEILLDLLYDQRPFSNDVLKKWVSYWKEARRAQDVIEVFEVKYLQSNFQYLSGKILLDIFELSLEVYGKDISFKWAYRASAGQIIDQRYFYHKPFFGLDKIAEIYSKRWIEFIQKVSLEIEEQYGKRPGYNIGPDTLVYFLFKVGEFKLATQITESMLSSLEDDVAHLALPHCKWID